MSRTARTELDGIISRASGCRHRINTSVFNVSSVPTEPVKECIFFQSTGEGASVYSNAHIAKVWTLEATALSDARRVLIDLRAGETLTDEFVGKTEEQIQRDIRELLSKESGDAISV
eukprot:COSAG01_NODE_1449_length_10271_cov_6.347976_4_plen_117_part_00